MTEALQFVRRGAPQVWLFSIDLPDEEVAGFVGAPAPGAPWPVSEALGAGPVDATGIDVVDLGRPGDGGLPRHLDVEHGVLPDDLGADADRLAGLDGHVMIVASTATKGRSGAFVPVAPLQFIGGYRARRSPASKAAISGRVAMVALIVMFALAAAVVVFSG